MRIYELYIKAVYSDGCGETERWVIEADSMEEAKLKAQEAMRTKTWLEEKECDILSIKRLEITHQQTKSP